MKTKQLATDAILAAMCAVLGAVSLDLQSFKLTFESLPVIMAALMFGPADGMAVGGVGTLIYQLLRYGVSVTTPLWILPYVLCGLFAGLYAKKHHFSLSTKETGICMLFTGFTVLILNTLTIYVDSRIFGYYTPALIMGSLALRIVTAVLKAVIFTLLLPVLIRSVRKGLHI